MIYNDALVGYNIKSHDFKYNTFSRKVQDKAKGLIYKEFIQLNNNNYTVSIPINENNYVPQTGSFVLKNPDFVQ